MTYSGHIRGAVLVALVALTSPLAAQDSTWHSVLEANATVLFGANSQTLTSTAASISRKGSAITTDATLKFRYGESTDEQHNSYVSSRGWAATLSADMLPKEVVSPFVFGSSEASLEKRIINRSSGGLGAKWAFLRSATGSASLSLAVLGERTAPMRDSIALPTVTVARWSWRVKFDQKIGDKLSFTHVSFYSPSIRALSQYTITTTSVGAYAITSQIAFTLTLTDSYDSQAMLRGAPSNNDGALLFGLRSAF
jgi:hypothetical protein